jgi:hypothetical protein
VGGGDTTPPTVSIQTPASGAIVSGTVGVVANATDDQSVARVELYLDGAVLGSASGSQYSASWDTTKAANGTHALSARAYDQANNLGVSADVPVTVQNGNPNPGPGQDLIVNGGFEGSLRGWTLGGVKKPIDSSAHPFDGSYSLRCGSTSRYYEPAGDSYAYQAVTIPAGVQSATLSYWYYAYTTDTYPNDYQEELVLDENGNELIKIFRGLGNTRTWTQKTVDLSSLAGRTVLVYFNVHSDGAYDPTALYIDDVSLKVSGSGGGGDTTPPTVSLTAPTNGATVSGTVSLAATASDNVGVTKVSFLVDGAVVATSAAAPYAGSWDTTSAANGAHAIVAQAWDAAGNVGTSATVTVAVQNGTPGDTTPPTVSIVSPASGATVSGNVAVSAQASDNVGVTRVELYADGALIGTSTASPYAATWSTAAVANGGHSLLAKAYDAAGNVGTSAAVSVTVSNSGPPDTTPPTVSLTSPASGATLSGAVSITASATDNVGVARVEFYVDGALLGTSTAAPYSASWSTTSATNAAHTLLAKAWDAAGNVGTSQAVTVTVSNGGSSGGIKTVFVILMENHNWSSIKGSASAPYINNTLLPMGAHAENYVNLPGIHPSEPNYIWLEAGTNFGIADDSPPSVNHQSTTQHLTTQLVAAGHSWKAYQEGISGTSCPLTTSGLFAPKHLGMLFFDDVTNGNSASSQNCIAHVRPYTQLAGDLSGNTVADYNFITPNMCNDMHNSSGCASSDAVANGDNWLAAEVPKILASAAYKSGGALFITWDESEGGDHPIGMIVLSPNAKPGYSNSIAYSHSSTLRTLQEIFRVSPLLGDAANATDLSDLFRTFP